MKLCHTDQAKLGDAIDALDEMSKKYCGCVDRDNIDEGFGYGTLTASVISHRGTAKRNDGVRSWEDEDAKSGSTYFNAPAPVKSSARGSMAGRLSGK